MGWPGLAQECDEICEKLKIKNSNETNTDEKEHRKYVVSACHLEIRGG